jgi:non-specific serine/threonine protein kinase
MVQAFQRDDGPPIFVLSLRAGGFGLNLTRANHVFHFDRWWNPAVENQATDRAFRIGQKRNVLVHKFVCRGTLEERIDELIRSKQQLADEILGKNHEGERMLTEMTDRDLLNFVALDVRSCEI